MTPEKLKKIIKELQKRVDDSWEQDDEDAAQLVLEIGEAIVELKNWRDQGMTGDLPVDLSPWGYTLIDEETEALEQQTSSAVGWSDEIVQAEDLLKTRDGLLPAINLLQRIVKERSEGTAIRTRAEELLVTAQTKRGRLVQNLIDEARSQRQADPQRAEDLYREILRLDKDNQRAQNELNALQQQSLDDDQREQIKAIKDLLRKHWRGQDLEALDEVVRDAENLVSRNVADDELRTSLETARQLFDKLRIEHGRTTTKMRMGDLNFHVEAIDEVDNLIIGGATKIWDATADVYRPATEMLAAARNELKKTSRKQAQIELDEVEKALPHRVDWARERLQDALKQPFEHDDESRLSNRLGKIEEMIANRDAANALIEDARGFPPKERLDALIEAQGLWPHRTGIDRLVDQQRRNVISMLADDMRAKKDEARIEFQARNFDEVLEILSATKSIPTGENISAILEPSSDLPDVLQTALDDCMHLADQVEKQKEIDERFRKLESQVSTLLADPQTHKVAITLFDDKIKPEKDFQDHPGLSLLEIAINPYREDLASQWNTIESYHNSSEPKWKTIQELCQNLLDTGVSGEFADRVRILQNEAQIELSRRQAARQVDDGEIRLARDSYMQIQTTLEIERQSVDTKRKDAEKRLSAKGKLQQQERDALSRQSRILERIEEAYKHRKTQVETALKEIEGYTRKDDSIQEIMDVALGKKDSKDDQEKLEALKTFQQIANGDKSSFTAQAKREAQLLTIWAREELLTDIIEVTQNIANKSLTDIALKNTLDEKGIFASSFRECGLVWEREDKKAIRTLELAFEYHNAEKLLELEKWGAAKNAWKQLESSWPGDLDVQIEARQARKLCAIKQAQSELTQNADTALKTLLDCQQDESLYYDPELNLELAKVYRKLKNYKAAEDCAIHAIDSDKASDEIKTEAKDLRDEVRADSSIGHELEHLRNLVDKGNYIIALERFSKLSDHLQSRPDMVKFREETLRKAQTDLMDKATREMDKKTSAGMIKAVTELVRLQQIESLCGLQEGIAEDRLREYQNQLPKSAKKTLQAAKNFSLNDYLLDKALAGAHQLAEQADAFASVGKGLIEALKEQIKKLEEFGVEELSVEQSEQLANAQDDLEEWMEIQPSLQEQDHRLRDLYRNLETIKTQLQGITSETWETAIRTGNFSILEAARTEIVKLAGRELTLVDIQEFRIKLDEYKDVQGYVSEQLDEIKKLFVNQEEFDKTIELCDMLHNRPQRQTISTHAKTESEKSEHWKFVDLETYQQILSWSLGSFNFRDHVLGINLSQVPEVEVGETKLEKVIRLSKSRAENLSEWKNWFLPCEDLYGRVSAAYTGAEQTHYRGAMTELRHWNDVLTEAEQAIEHFEMPPENLLSLEAKKIKQAAAGLAKEIKTWVNKAEWKVRSYKDCRDDPANVTMDKLGNLMQGGHIAYVKLAEFLIRAKVNTQDDELVKVIPYWEGQLARMEKLPSEQELSNLFQKAETCLGENDPLTGVLHKAIVNLHKSREDDEKGSLWQRIHRK